MSYIKIITISILVMLTAQHSFAANGQYDFGTISRDTTFAWSAQLPMYSPSVSLYFKTAKKMYVSIELNGTINCVQDMSQGLNIQVGTYRLDSQRLPAGNYFVSGVVAYNILDKYPYAHVQLKFMETLPSPSKPDDEADYSSLPNVFPNELDNYICAYEPTSPSSSMSRNVSSNIVNRFYYDAFGRKVETVMSSFSPTKRDVVTLYGYDHYGRESENWKAAEFVWDDACDNGYVYPDDIQKEAIDFYNDSCPYSRTVYEHSPLNRSCGELGMGYNWRKNGRNKSVEYLFSDDQLTCIRWEEKGNVFYNLGAYGLGDISVVKHTDEDGNITYEFIDDEGRKILQRRQCQGLDHDTYYLYDKAGNLRYILPPAFSTYPSSLDEESKEMEDFAYMYVYDDRKRCVKMKLPGCEWTYNIYDRGDNLAFVQDGELRKRGEWRFCIYDKNKRPCLEGVCKNHFNVDEISELDVSATYTGANTFGYRVDGMSLTSPRLLNANYYDDYSFLGTGNGHYVANGLLTSSLSAVLADESESRYLTTVYYYDGKGRIVEQVSGNVMGGTDRSLNSYTFRGNLKERQVVHELGGKTIKETYSYNYDHVERLTGVSYSLDGSNPVLLASYTYDKVGRLQGEVLGERVPVSYGYNVRDWQTVMSSSVFSQNLFFECGAPQDVDVSNSYNGNISAVYWKQGEKAQAYSYTYDGLDRLLYADHLDYSTSDEKYSTEYEYDKNGNVTYLMRQGMADSSTNTLQKLYFTYDGNQLVDVRNDAKVSTRKGDSTIGTIASSSDKCGREYNANGSVTKEADKGIVSIDYNLLNLPERITFKNGNSISYQYSGKGEKLMVAYKTAPTMVSPLSETMNLGSLLAPDSYVYDTLSYCGNFIYRNGRLLRVLNEKGFATPTSNSYDLHYFVKDYLGNVRVVTDANGNVEQSIDYYPFGSVIAESINAEMQPYLYNGKELDRMNGLDWYDYGARMYESDGIRWGQMDPLAASTPDVTPYGYCGNNPVRRIDYKGMFYGDYYDSKGNLLGNDGIDDEKIYVMRTTRTSFDSYGDAPVKNISRKHAKAAAREIREYSGDATHDFSDAQKSFVELDGSSDIRKVVVSCIKDDGTGETSDNNNREYGMNFEKKNPVKVYSKLGDIAKPDGHFVSVEVAIHPDLATIHSHPSGNIIPNLQPAPSVQDVANGLDNCNSYVIDMANKMVYIYNKTGILSSFPLNIYTK